MIRDGHGDLRAEDIFLLEDGPRILDCIEFPDRYRHGDVLADVAFLAMDLERLSVQRLEADLMHWYDEFSGHTHPWTLADHYIAYRAQVPGPDRGRGGADTGTPAVRPAHVRG